MCVMVPSLGLLGESINIAMLIASISLAATVRKLAWPLVQRNPAEACKTTATLPTGHDAGGTACLMNWSRGMACLWRWCKVFFRIL